jgi:hypothetical protein
MDAIIFGDMNAIIDHRGGGAIQNPPTIDVVAALSSDHPVPIPSLGLLNRDVLLPKHLNGSD